MIPTNFPKTEAGDPVDHPAHYVQRVPGIEAIEVTKHFDFCRGNAIKYIWRAGLKGDELEDLRKARWYLDRAISDLEAKREDATAIRAWTDAGAHPVFGAKENWPETPAEKEEERLRLAKEASVEVVASGRDAVRLAAKAVAEFPFGYHIVTVDGVQYVVAKLERPEPVKEAKGETIETVAKLAHPVGPGLNLVRYGGKDYFVSEARTER